MNLPDNYVLLNMMSTYAGPKVSTFAACGQLSPDGKSLGMVSKQGTIVKIGKSTAWVAGIIFNAFLGEALAFVKVLPNGNFAQFKVKLIKPLQNAQGPGVHAETALPRLLPASAAIRTKANEFAASSVSSTPGTCLRRGGGAAGPERITGPSNAGVNGTDGEASSAARTLTLGCSSDEGGASKGQSSLGCGRVCRLSRNVFHPAM